MSCWKCIIHVNAQCSFYNFATATAELLLLPTSRFINLLLLLLSYCYCQLHVLSICYCYCWATTTANFTFYNFATATAVLLLLPTLRFLLLCYCYCLLSIHPGNLPWSNSKWRLFSMKKGRFIIAVLASQAKFSNLLAGFSYYGRTFCIMALLYVQNVYMSIMSC
jgi:hypothetical protein